MKYASFELSVVRLSVRLMSPIPFPSSMHFLNEFTVHSMFFPVDCDFPDYLGASINGFDVVDQRTVSNCFFSLVSQGNNFKYDRMPSGYFANTGLVGSGLVGQGGRPSPSMKWPEINQKIDWKASFIEFTNVPLTDSSFLLCVQYG